MKQCERPFTANAPKKALPDLAGLFECALCHGGKGLMRNGCGFVYQFGRVGGRHKTGLVGRGAESHAALEHAVEDAFEGFGVGGLPDRLRQALLVEMQHYKAHEKILIMATQVTYEGSSMDTYVVGRAAREQLPFLETYDMTLEAVLAKIMWILGLHMEDRKEIERLFYKKINYDLFRNE